MSTPEKTEYSVDLFPDETAQTWGNATVQHEMKFSTFREARDYARGLNPLEHHHLMICEYVDGEEVDRTPVEVSSADRSPMLFVGRRVHVPKFGQTKQIAETSRGAFGPIYRLDGEMGFHPISHLEPAQ